MTITTKKGGLRLEPSVGPAAFMLASAHTSQELGPAAWTRLDGALLVYLFLPLPIFLLGFFVPWQGVPVAAVALAALVAARPFAAPVARLWTGPTLAGALLLIAFAAAWTSLGGAGHLFHANSIDWLSRYGVLRDLVTYDWPPRYLDQEGQELILRAPLGYYLVPALFAKFAGIAWADRLLLLWTWLGVSLFFLANFAGTARKRLVVLILFAAASGLDIVGVFWKDGLPWLGSHIEWWTGRIKYSSNSTMLYWIPNHVIPAWALGAWLWRLQYSADLLWRLPLIGLAVMLWSPLPVVGALPMIGVLVWRFHGELLAKPRALAQAVLGVLLPALLVAGYLLMSASRIGAWAIAPPLAAVAANRFTWWSDTLMFLLLEVLVFAVLAQRCSRSAVLTAGILLLCLLPFFSFGPTNDLATLGAIPALTVMWLTLINELSSPPSQRRLSQPRRALLLLLLLVGAVTPFQETYRALTGRHWTADPTLPAPVAMHGFPSHYFAPTSQGFAAILNKTPALPASAMDWKRRGRN